MNSYLYILRGNLEDAPIPNYDQVFGLDGPGAEMRPGFNQIEETALPFVVNVVDPDKDQDSSNMYNNSTQMNGHCAMPVTHDLTLREYLTKKCDQLRFFGNRRLYRDFMPNSQAKTANNNEEIKTEYAGD